MFQRGETQVINVTTMGMLRMEQMLDTISIEESKRYMHHYNFPPFSTGETGFMRGPKRREIGHGALAERSLLPLIPKEEDWPYTIRIVSDILESNGSSSMASVCGATLGLMAAGVPITNPVAGISVGLVQESDDNWVLLTDIIGDEDHFGDMDFKVAGTVNGVNALQMDIKIEGITKEIMEIALEAGADDIVTGEDGSIEVQASPEAFDAVVAAMKDGGYEPANSEVTMRASTEVELDVDGGQKVLRLLDTLEDLDDTQEVYSNADIPDEAYEDQ